MRQGTSAAQSTSSNRGKRKGLAQTLDRRGRWEKQRGVGSFTALDRVTCPHWRLLGRPALLS